jgi:integrase
MSISRKNQRWYVQVDVPAGPDGKRRRRGVGGFKTKREAKAAEAEALRRIRDGVFVEPSRLTVGAYLTEMWLPSMVSQVRATTLGGYRHNVRAYIVPRLGDISLQRLTSARVGAFYGDLVSSGGKGGRPLSPKTVRYVHTTLRRALRDAVADGLVVRNVAAQARPPRARRVEMHTWTAAEVGAFLASVREDRLYVAWLLLATLGLRRGELLGLRWLDVDLTTGRIAIRNTLVMVDGKPAMAEPKTAKGRRSLTVAPEVLEAVRVHRARQAAERLSWGAGYIDSGLVITTEDGRPMHPETLSGLFVRQAKRAGLPPIRLHDLRHSVASILLAQGVHPKVVSEQLGHATIALTLDTYSHIIPSLQQEAAGVMATAILGSGATPQRGAMAEQWQNLEPSAAGEA